MANPTYFMAVGFKQLTLRSKVVLLSFAATSTAGFVGLATTGARHGCRASVERGGSPLYRPQIKPSAAD